MVRPNAGRHGIRTGELMRPTKNMFATQEEWIEALANWIEEEPTLVNDKQFMIFEDTEVSAENFMFEGNLLDFSDCYFSASEWSEVLAFAEENGYTIVVEDDDRWEELGIMLDDAEVADDLDIDFDVDDGISNKPSSEQSAEWGSDYRSKKHN
jgi:hypothetical protein